MADISIPRFHPENVRLAQPSETLRTAFVASAGFYHSPANAYERPQRDKYPKDTVLSYHQELLHYIKKPECVLIVLDDDYDDNEDTKLYPALKEEYGGRDWRERDGKVIVGFACFTLRHGSARKGRYQPDNDSPNLPDDEDNLERDQSREGVDKLAKAIGSPMEKHFGGEFSVDMIAVHPNYWRRGHGTSLLMWATRLADEDQVCLGIASVPMGISIAHEVDFKEREIIEVKGYSKHPESFTVWIGVRECGPLPPRPKTEQEIGWGAWLANRLSYFSWRRDG